MSRHPLDVALEGRRTITLDQVIESAPLLRRFDNKHVAAIDVAAGFLSSLPDHWTVLTVDGHTSMRYLTTYFDDERLVTYRDHLQGRRPRFKIRARTYENGTSFLEVKAKTGRGQTVKTRVARPIGGSLELSDHERAWLDDTVGRIDSRSLRPGLRIDCERITLHSFESGERLTVDHGMRVSLGSEWCPLLDGGVVIESKSGSLRGSLFTALARHDLRAVSFSKYCAGLSVVDPDIHPRIRVEAERAVQGRV
ncbi:MAG: polyphosphate polymerase domain-containing protein [Actinomycetota bacterium]